MLCHDIAHGTVKNAVLCHDRFRTLSRRRKGAFIATMKS